MNDQHDERQGDPAATPVVEQRREFLYSLGKWSGAVIGSVALGGVLFSSPAPAGGWINRRGGYGGGGWVNRGGGGGWINGGGGGGWINGGGGGGWINGGGGGWINGGGSWINGGGGGGGWINRRGGGGGWINR